MSEAIPSFKQLENAKRTPLDRSRGLRALRPKASDRSFSRSISTVRDPCGPNGVACSVFAYSTRLRTPLDGTSSPMQLCLPFVRCRPLIRSPEFEVQSRPLTILVACRMACQLISPLHLGKQQRSDPVYGGLGELAESIHTSRQLGDVNMLATMSQKASPPSISPLARDICIASVTPTTPPK